MSTSIPIAAGSIQAAPEISVNSSILLDTTDQDAQAPEGGFSAVLADFMQAALPPGLVSQTITDPANKHAGTAPGLITTSALPELPASVNDSTGGNTLPGAIPVVAWSGMVAVGDEQGAAAMLMGGDGKQTLIGKPVQATNINTAMQLADQQALMKPLSPITGSTTWENILPAQLQLANAQRNAGMPIVAEGQQLLGAADGNVFAVLTQEPGITQTGTNIITPYAATARAEAAVGNIAVPITHPNWSNNLGESIKWMVQQHTQHADLRLTPPDLGMLEVRVQVNNNQTNITFSSPHAQVCDAVESALPRLREMFGQTGLQLGDVNVNVSHQSLSQQHAQNGDAQTPGHGGGDGHAEDNDAITHAVSPLLPRYGAGLVDVYA